MLYNATLFKNHYLKYNNTIQIKADIVTYRFYRWNIWNNQYIQLVSNTIKNSVKNNPRKNCHNTQLEAAKSAKSRTSNFPTQTIDRTGTTKQHKCEDTTRDTILCRWEYQQDWSRWLRHSRSAAAAYMILDVEGNIDALVMLLIGICAAILQKY